MLIISGTGRFQTDNVSLQNNLIKISFPMAIDKNNYLQDVNSISYRVRYNSRQIHCAGSGNEYIFNESEEDIRTSEWQTITNLVLEGGIMSFMIVTPSFQTDVSVTYEIEAMDDYSNTLNIIKESSTMFLVRNTYSTVSISNLDWYGSNNDVRVEGNIADLGFTTPENDYHPTYAAQYEKWKQDLASIFGNFELNFYYSYGINSNNLSELIKADGVNFLFLDRNLKEDSSFTFEIQDNVTLSPNNTYYFKVFLIKELISPISNGEFTSTLNPNTLFTSLLGSIPEFQIKKGVAKVNISRLNSAKTGGMMAARGSQQSEAETSLALYDYLIKDGEIESANEPSIGFYDVNNVLISKITSFKGSRVDRNHLQVSSNFMTEGVLGADTLLVVNAFSVGATESMVCGMGGVRTLKESDNLDYFRLTGMYEQTDNTKASLSNNYPVETGGMLTVKRIGDVSENIYQTYHCLDNSKIYHRVHSQGVWSAWN